MDDLVRWLGEQLDEDERMARAATSGPWRAHDTHLGQYGYAATVLSGEGNDTDLRAWLPSMSQEPWDEARNVWADAEHVAEWDPARVLREISVDRELLAEYERLLRASAAHRKEADRMAEAGDDDPIRRAALCREADYLPAMLNVLEGWAKRKAGVYTDRPGYAEAIASLK